MARHFRRLTFWLLAGLAVPALLALVALALLWFFFDPDDYRAQIESRASTALGRRVRLTGALSWQLGRRIAIVSEGGEIANAAGFGPEPMARWTRIRLGVAARPLLDKQVLIDHIEVQGLQLLLQRDAQGRVNWALPAGDAGGRGGQQAVSVRIAEVAVQDATLRYRDAGAESDWLVTSLQASAKLPADFMAPAREFRDVAMRGRLAGGPVAQEGVAFELRAAALQLAPQQLLLPAFTARWADAMLEGEVTLQPDVPGIEAKFTLQAPSLRALLATIGVEPPPMRDTTTLGALNLALALRYAAGAATVDGLSLNMDGTHLTGRIELPRLQPLAARFNLAADRVDLDRYREPVDVKSEPLELPLAWLKQLDARGTLRIREAIIAGAAAKQVRIDVE